MARARAKKSTAVIVGGVLLVAGLLVVWSLPDWEWLGRVAVTTGAIIAVVPFLADWLRRK